MKRTHRLAPLLMSLLYCGAFSPATAQTLLLEIDYQNATVFHVLSDGRLVLPLGAVDGYVLTADDQGYATWQASTGTGGLMAVTSDATLTGQGTAGLPLGVSVPLMLTGSANGVVEAMNTTGTYGVLGSTIFGAYGEHEDGHFGYFGGPNVGAFGRHQTGIYGTLGSDDYGAYGEHTNDNYGTLGSVGAGVFGEYNNENYGFLGGLNDGAVGRNNNGNLGTLGSSTYGAYGLHNIGHWGTLGGSIYGVHGRNTNNNRGYLGHDSYGVWATGSPWAGYFAGNVHVTGTLSGGSAASKVDHPLDPANRYLAQSFVESAEMKTVYDGTVTLDGQGEALVVLPSYVEALNGNFRYQLTAIGAPGPNLYIAEKIQGNQFKIGGGAVGMEVSWQVTGIRHDPWAEQNRLVVEADKPAAERGRYLHPRLYGQAEAQRIGSVEEDSSVEQEAMQQHLDEQRRQIDEEHQHMDEERRQIEQERRRMQAEHERLQRQRAQPASPPDNHR